MTRLSKSSRVFVAAAILFVCALRAAPALAEPRIALIVGNSGYSTVTQLDNPVNDARLIAQTLTDLGFEVTSLLDATQAEMRRGISAFGRQLRDAGPEATGLFYYAGHGVQSFGSNYLLPVDVALTNAADLDLVAIEAQSVLRQMFSARNRTNIVILDACRDNPFPDMVEFGRSGLAEMQAPTGTFLAYATAPGEVALDGLDGHSPFTRAVADQMRVPGQPIEQMFKAVRVEVLKRTQGTQTPWDASSLTSDFKFAPEAAATVPEVEAGALWETVRDSKDAVQIMLFLRGYPNSPYAAEARRTLARLMEQELSGGTDASPAPEAEMAGPSVPDPAEEKMFAAAQADGSRAGYEAYLQIYPDGDFAETARDELAALTEPEEAPAAPQPVTGIVTFATPLDAGVPEIDGQTISDLLASSPLYPPLDGLPEFYWKDQSCNTCHQWTREQLCGQGNTYLSANMQRSLGKKHPFGGGLKQHLRSWAAGGCQ